MPVQLIRSRLVLRLAWLMIVAVLLGACGTGAPELPAESPAELAGSLAEQVGDGLAENVEQALCTETNPHPIAENISKEYEVAYDQVMEWFCDGAPFEDILLALETHELTELPVDELLARAEDIGWEQLWAELGLTEGIEPQRGDE